MKTILGWARRLLWLVPLMQASGAVPFYDGFDASPTYGPGTNFLAPINGWGPASTNVQVTSSLYDTAPHSVQMVGSEVLSNSVGGATGQIWTECRVRPFFGEPPSLTSNGTASLAGYFTTNHCFAYATNGGWVLCSNTIWGVATPELTEGQFVRITIFQNYATSNSAVFVNSNLVAQDLRFYGDSATYRAFLAKGGEFGTTSHWDTVSFSNGPPGDIVTDANGDGIHDVDELALYGYAMQYLVVATNNAAYTNLQMAFDVSRTRDVIVVSNGTYAGNLTLTHDVTITGGSFTNTGALTVSSGVTVSLLATGVYGSASVSGTVNLAASGMLTVTGSLVMGSSGVIQATGGGLASASPNVVLGGTFSVAGSNWNNSAAQSVIPFSDGFETYAVGAPLASYSFNGWGASAPTVLVETQTVAVGAKAVTVADGESVSNRVDGAPWQTVWTDMRLQPVPGGEAGGLPTNTSTCVLYFDTNGYVEVYSPSNGWMICSSNAAGAAVTNVVSGNRFVRMTVFSDFVNKLSAVFMDGELLRERVPFGPQAPTTYNRFKVDNRLGGAAYMDEVSVRSTPPVDLSGDTDGDGISDVRELLTFGTIFGPRGSVFKIR
jgi:hypothetical protein